MGYFKDITSGQCLEDLDISVHCDVFIFEWLISWIKEDEKPELEPENVISILISADFLKISPLVETALSYVHRNMNKVLSVTTNLSCLSDHLLNRLSELYKPSEVEMILDRKDRIQSRLYSKLIQRLCAILPQYDREILDTAFSLHRCELCGLFLTSSSAKTLPCLSFRSKIDHRGNIVPIHKRDPSFNMNEFLKALRLELKSWRKVFWRLWGMIHILYCSLCGVYFPVYLHEFCSFHSADPVFDGIQFKNSTHPFGQYDCCKSKVFRFQTLSPSSRGCQSREHRVKLRADRDKKTYRILLAHREIICLVPFRKGGLRISSDVNSITLPSNNVRISSGDKISEEISENISHFRYKRGLIDRKVLEISGLNRANASSNSRPTNKSIKRNPSSLYTLTGDESFCVKDNSPKPASSYGRLKREPKLPSKKFYQSSSSSSSSEDEDDDEEEDRSEDGNSSIADLDHSEDTKVISKPPLIKDVASVDIKGAKDTGLNKESLTSSWISDRSTRANQDQQRENEENITRDILRYLCQKQLSHSKQTDPTPTTSKNNHSPEAILSINRVWSSGGSIPQLNAHGGSFLRLEQDWKDTHLAYLQHRTSSNSSISQGRIRPLSAVAGLRVTTRMRASKSLANLSVQN
ncbi:Uncharacterized protein KIAA1841 [Lepeophtheirus salmonis]|uniref:Uncharacterized protein KIAA1841 n=1 Tax=Lepeophtheirus salmonis TaxID=72036 RepID=A0A7R8HAG6_LEPSM|nr:Uncharacterized protein KIAA1841 [Lepeophtheirus salmonis]CAF2966565.1 Uncharacterized protein KIAA1841 [Lepeophtheirus salmonis]